MAAVTAPPILHILAGPNGAGKTTLYEAWVRRLTDAEFVNADRLCLQALGRHAKTREDAELGQRLANERRAALLAAGMSLVTETTFSHPSKLDLITQARDLGYRVVVYTLVTGEPGNLFDHSPPPRSCVGGGGPRSGGGGVPREKFAE
jgi:predicted ABC-type ATPase